MYCLSFFVQPLFLYQQPRTKSLRNQLLLLLHIILLRFNSRRRAPVPQTRTFVQRSGLSSSPASRDHHRGARHSLEAFQALTRHRQGPRLSNFRTRRCRTKAFRQRSPHHCQLLPWGSPLAESRCGSSAASLLLILNSCQKHIQEAHQLMYLVANVHLEAHISHQSSLLTLTTPL